MVKLNVQHRISSRFAPSMKDLSLNINGGIGYLEMIAEGVPHSKFDVGRSMFDVQINFYGHFFGNAN